MDQFGFNLKWFAIFAVLSSFTLMTFLSHMSYFSPQKAYAAKIMSDPALDTSKYWVVLGEKALSNKSNHPNRQFWLGLDRAYETQQICGIDNSQFRVLAERYGAEKQDILIKDKNIKIVTVPYSQQSKRNVRQDLKFGDLDIQNNCRVLDQNYLFYLVFNGEIS